MSEEHNELCQNQDVPAIDCPCQSPEWEAPTPQTERKVTLRITFPEGSEKHTIAVDFTTTADLKKIRTEIVKFEQNLTGNVPLFPATEDEE